MRRSARVNPFQKAAKIKAAVKAHPLKNIRRAFRNFSTEEAWTFVVRLKGKRMFCRVDRKKSSRDLAERNRLVLDLFHRLYPKNSLTPVGVMRVPSKAILGYYPEEFEFHKLNKGSDDLNQMLERSSIRQIKGVQKFPVWGVVTEIERRQSPDFKVYQNELRSYVHFSSKSENHLRFIYGEAIPLSRIIFAESGISVNYMGNMSNKNGNPLFFEPKITSPKRLIACIKSKPSNERVALMRIAKRLGLA
jgi:hypothetical protein